jgi:hypothetical protein
MQRGKMDRYSISSSAIVRKFGGILRLPARPDETAWQWRPTWEPSRATAPAAWRPIRRGKDNHMAKKRNATKTKIKRKRTEKKNKSKKQPAFESIVTYVPGIPT